MKNKLKLLFLSSFLLSGCDLNNLAFWKKTQTNNSNQTQENGDFFEKIDTDFGIIKNVEPYVVSDTKTVMDNSSSFKFHGRHYYDGSLQAEFINFSNAGFEVSFVGTTLEACFYASSADSNAYRPYIGVCIDDDYDPSRATPIQLTTGVNSNADGFENGYSRHSHIVLAHGLENKKHTVRVYKRSEVVFSKLAIKSVSTDGEICENVSPKSLDLKMEFFGDSVTCGYGVEASSFFEKFSTRTENSMKSFANYAANYLNADCSHVSVGGYAMYKSKYTETNEPSNIPGMFTLANVDWVTTNKITWDNSKYIPDVVVIALGANDGSYLADFAVGSTLYNYAIKKYTETYNSFLDAILNAYPNTQIIVSSEILDINSIYETKMNEIVESYNQAHPNLTHKLVRIKYNAKNLSSDKMLPCEGHPNEEMQHIAGKELATKISEVLNISLHDDGFTY